MTYERKTTDILISDELKAILQQIESDSVVAKLLLKKRHYKEDLVENPVNWISISSDDKTKISYLTPERAEKIPNSEHWNSSKRFHAKPGAFISKVFSGIESKEIEKFSTLFRNVSNRTEVSFSVFRGEAMKKWYLASSYTDSSGSLGSSCMRYQKCQDYLGIYTENSMVSMLVMLDRERMLIGRALLWDFDGNKLMDRIYTTNDEEYQFYFKEWATKNGYLYRSKQNWSDTLDFENLETPKKKIRFEISLDDVYFDEYPYMDTFKFISFTTKKIYNYQPSVNFSTLCSSEGSIMDSDYLVMDGIDGVFRYRNDASYIESRGIWTHPDNTVWSDTNQCYILREDAKYVDEIDDYIYRDRSLNRESNVEI